MKKYGTLAVTLILALISLAVWALPNMLTAPLESQTADDIALSYRLFRAGPWVAGGLALVGVLLTARAWRQHGGWVFRGISVVPLLALCCALYLSRASAVELMMFSPVDEARFVRAAEAGFLSDDALVLGVARAGEAKAYPVGMLVYHHIVNDRLAGEPFVATY